MGTEDPSHMRAEEFGDDAALVLLDVETVPYVPAGFTSRLLLRYGDLRLID
jgi:hypothetical protein